MTWTAVALILVVGAFAWIALSVVLSFMVGAAARGNGPVAPPASVAVGAAKTAVKRAAMTAHAA